MFESPGAPQTDGRSGTRQDSPQNQAIACDRNITVRSAALPERFGHSHEERRPAQDYRISEDASSRGELIELGGIHKSADVGFQRKSPVQSGYCRIAARGPVSEVQQFSFLKSIPWGRLRLSREVARGELFGTVDRPSVAPSSCKPGTELPARWAEEQHLHVQGARFWVRRRSLAREKDSARFVRAQ
jgi:hypothetical protein